MDEEKRTLITEYSNTVIDVNSADLDHMEISQYAIDTMAKYFLKRMREEVLQGNDPTQ
jgi:hypothetical protein